MLAKIFAGSKAGLLFESPIERCFGIKTRFECQAKNGAFVMITVFYPLLETFVPVAIDIVEEVFPKLIIDQFRELMAGRFRKISQFSQAEARVEVGAFSSISASSSWNSS